MTTVDPRLEITEHYVRAQAKMLAERAKKHIANHGRFEPMMLIICRKSPHDGTDLDTTLACVPVVHRGGRTDEERELTLFAARAIAIAGEALATVICLNSMAVFAKGPEESKKLFEQSQSGNFTVDEHPDRVETNFTFIEWATNKVECVSAYRVVRDQGFVDFDEIAEEFKESCLEVNNALAIMPRVEDPPPPHIIEAARKYARDIVIDVRTVMRDRAERGQVSRG